jgi:hypothetical protein
MANPISSFALLAIPALLIILPGSVHAQINCQVTDSCSDAELMEMSAESNAHAALMGESPYDYVLCCSGIDGLKGGSGDLTQDILRLSAKSNAHAENPALTNYDNPVTLSIDNNPQVTDFECSYSPDGCATGEDCIITLSAETNAHVAGCGSTDSYTQAICCEVTLDEAAPEVEDDYEDKAGQWQNETQTIRLTATDNVGIDEIWYAWAYEDCSQSGCDNIPVDDSCVTACSPLSGQGEPMATCDIPVSQNKNDNLCYFATDIAGNRPAWDRTYVKVDLNLPQTDCVNCPDDNQIVGKPFVVTLEAADQTAGVDKESGPDSSYLCYYRDSGSCSFHEYSSPETIGLGSECGSGETKCEYTIEYYSTDVAGNQESPHQRRITYDKSYPSCEFSSSLPGTLDTRKVYLSWSANDPISGSAFVSYEITAKRSSDGGSTYPDKVGSHTETSEGTTTYDFDLTEDGYYRFECVVTYNRDGTPISSSPGLYEVLVDTTPPVLQLTGSNPDYSNQETFSIVWTVDDINNIDHYVLEVNGSVADSSIPGSQTNIEYTGEHGKSYEISLTAYDMAGNPSTPAEKTVTVDTEPPACSVTPPGEFINKTTFNIAWSSPDEDAESFDICFKEKASDCTNPLPGWKELTVTYKEFTGTHGNTHYFRCRATDIAGNLGEWSSPESTTIDARAPALPEVPDYPSTVTSSDYDDMPVNATVTDDFGIKDVTLIIGGNVVSPKEKTGKTGDTQWTIRWDIPYDTYAAKTSFSIVMTDVNSNVDTQNFTYSVYQCKPGEYRECDPEDPVTKEPYTQGVCRHTGNRTCGSDGMWGNCTGGTLPTDETCDKLDDDCDGKTDEGLQDVPCGPLDKVTTGKSICRLGAKSCVNGTWSACEGARYPETQEICNNGWDDDCDGVEDNGCDCANEGEKQPCGESNVGICQLGTKTCKDGKWTTCQNAVYPETELCNDDYDNDCDGYTDCDDPDCYGSSVCEGPEPDGEPFPWWILSVIGVIILVVLVLLLLYLRRQGEELTWETVKKKWSY